MPAHPSPAFESIDEKFVSADGAVRTGRRLNDDETGQGQDLRLFSSDAANRKTYWLRLYRYR